jgi:secondary thiamine-phosphate synthase enzyme
MDIQQAMIRLHARPRGFHLVTAEIVRGMTDLAAFSVGLAHLLVQHTSAGLTLNENADPDVRTDFSTIFDSLVPDGAPEYVHTIEGPDDMSAHVKSSLVGASLTIPIRDGALALGRWQGIYLCEYRNRATDRTIVATVIGTRR